MLLACGPTLETFIPFILMGALVLGGFKLLLYFHFVNAFRYRVATPVPMTKRTAWQIAVIRAAFGVVVIGGTWLVFYLSGLPNRPAIQTIWAVGTCERIAAWWALGALLAHVQGRRLVGWTLAGTAIDVATDVGLYFTGEYGLTSPILGFGGIAAAIVALHFIGRRPELLSRFTARPLCKSCGYDLTGNVLGVCPECGAPIAHPA